MKLAGRLRFFTDETNTWIVDPPKRLCAMPQCGQPWTRKQGLAKGHDEQGRAFNDQVGLCDQHADEPYMYSPP